MSPPLEQEYEVGRRAAHDPLVWIVDDFVTAEERDHVVALAAPTMSEAKVSRLGANAPSERRTGSVGWVTHHRTAVVRGLVRRVGDLVGLPVSHAESLQVVRYGVGQQYEPHFDAWDVTTAKGREKTVHGGNRLVTALMYLNEVDGGGATGFPELDLEIDAVPGRLCLFHNLVDGTGQRHPRALHCGLPVESGEKWACNLWFREHRYQRSPEAASSRAAPSAPQRPQRMP